MKKPIRTTNTLRDLSALRSLGCTNESIAALTGASSATIKRQNKTLARELASDDGRQVDLIKSTLENMHKAIRPIKFHTIASNVALEKMLKDCLRPQSDQWITVLWFGTISYRKPGRVKGINTIKNRIFIPEIKEDLHKTNDRGACIDKTLAERNSAKLIGHEKLAEKLANLNNALSLMGWTDQHTQQFCPQLAPSRIPTNHIPQKLPPLPPINDRVLKTLTPGKTRQPTQRKLLCFAKKHMARDPANFIYAERFKRSTEGQTENDKQTRSPSWWVYGPNDMLDWFD